MLNFKDINFGLASGEKEAVEYPDLVKKGFFDDDKIIEELIKGNKYLVLGYKGSGKSLIGEKLLFQSKEDKTYSCEKIMLSDFPFESLKKILPGSSSENNNFPKSWSLIILISLLNQMKKNNAKLEDLFLVKKLSEMGLLLNSDFASITKKASRKKFKVDISSLSFEYESENDYVNKFEYLLESLNSLLHEISPQKRHILVIDGLDDFLSLKDLQYDSLGGLIYEIGRLNDEFIRNSMNYKIIILSRIDLFEKMPIPNKNKQSRDSAIRINWYHDTREPARSNLVKLANMRAKIKDSSCTDLFEESFPHLISGKDAVSFLLDNTRHTPRDFIQLLTSIQKYCSGTKPTEKEILSGLKSYSEDYFLPEIKDEMVGCVSPESFEIFIQCLGSFRGREISISKLMEKCGEKIERKDLNRILSALFECSAIGNKFKGLVSDNMYCFRFRNRNCTFNPEETIVIHQGLLKALGVR